MLQHLCHLCCHQQSRGYSVCPKSGAGTAQSGTPGPVPLTMSLLCPVSPPCLPPLSPHRFLGTHIDAIGSRHSWGTGGTSGAGLSWRPSLGEKGMGSTSGRGGGHWELLECARIPAPGSWGGEHPEGSGTSLPWIPRQGWGDFLPRAPPARHSLLTFHPIAPLSCPGVHGGHSGVSMGSWQRFYPFFLFPWCQRIS